MAKGKQNRKLNLANLQKELKKVSTQTEYSININGEEYKYKVDDKFLKMKQHNVLDDLVAFLNECNKNLELLDYTTTYITLLLIKHFTTIEVSDDIDEAILLLNTMVNLEILEYIFSTLPEEEVLKFYELLRVTFDRMKENMEESSREAKKLAEIVENEELRKMLKDGGK